jgi:predicted site-specific integrase-resolvase
MLGVRSDRESRSGVQDMTEALMSLCARLYGRGWAGRAAKAALAAKEATS